MGSDGEGWGGLEMDGEGWKWLVRDGEGREKGSVIQDTVTHV